MNYTGRVKLIWQHASPWERSVDRDYVCEREVGDEKDEGSKRIGYNGNNENGDTIFRGCYGRFYYGGETNHGYGRLKSLSSCWFLFGLRRYVVHYWLFGVAD